MRAHTFRRSAWPSFVNSVVLAGAIASIAGCGGSDSTNPPPPPQDVWATLESAPWSLDANVEAYKCYVVHVTGDQYVTGFRLVAPSSIQAEVQLSMTETALPLGGTNCSIGTQAGRLIYTASKGTAAMEFPSGEGVHITAGSYLLVNIHLTNLTSATIQDSTRIEGRVGTAADVTTPLTMFLAGTLNLQIAADGQPHLQSGGCTSSTDQHVVAVIPLMRDRGTHQAVKLIASSDTTSILDAAYDPLHANFSVLAATLHVPAGGMLRIECTFVNNTGNILNAGDSSDSETCQTGIYHYATDAGSSNIYACAMGQSPDIVRARDIVSD